DPVADAVAARQGEQPELPVLPGQHRHDLEEVVAADPGRLQPLQAAHWDTENGEQVHTTRSVYPVRGSGSVLGEDEIDGPAAADVGELRVAAVAQDVRILAPGVFQRIRQDLQPVEGAISVNASGKRECRGRAPRGIKDFWV